MARPDPGEFERTDQSALFALVDEILREGPRHLDAVTEKLRRDGGFGLDVSHSFT